MKEIERIKDSLDKEILRLIQICLSFTEKDLESEINVAKVRLLQTYLDAAKYLDCVLTVRNRTPN